MLSDAHAAQRGLHKLSHDTAERLGQRYVSTTVAAALLEFMVFRRNLVPDMAGVPAPCVSVEGRRRRRRRSTYRMATSKIMAEEIVTFAVRMFAQEPRGDEDLISYVDRRLGSLGVAMARWHDMEARFNPEKVLEEKASDDGDDEDDIVMNANNGSEFAPMSPTRPEMAEFGGGGTRRRGEGAKRCSRCNRVKFTGSGHGRSKCDDGYSISSLVPYPASPREDGQGSN